MNVLVVDLALLSFPTFFKHSIFAILLRSFELVLYFPLFVWQNRVFGNLERNEWNRIS
ncbi:hypothetical protein PTUN_a4061 [Pseudoalteromonas tunicata]|nr:hypothetical protein PTUN_a4061 [Pseudoalteromonas tunicata]